MERVVTFLVRSMGKSSSVSSIKCEGFLVTSSKAGKQSSTALTQLSSTERMTFCLTKRTEPSPSKEESKLLYSSWRSVSAFSVETVSL